jgi:hypothetical protein
MNPTDFMKAEWICRIRANKALISAGLVLSLQKREKMLVHDKRDPALKAVDISRDCLMVSHYVQFLTLL